VDENVAGYIIMVKRTIPKRVEKKINLLKDNLKQDGVPISRMYLFGSYAKGNAHKWSDIDICVVSPKFGKEIKDPFMYMWMKQSELNDFELEPIGFTPKDFREGDSLIAEIKKHGIRII